MTRRRLDRLAVPLAAAGLAIAAYLTLLHYDTSVPLVCSAGSLIDCETVLTSPSATVLGVPVAAWGLLWFAVALTLAVGVARAGPRAAAGTFARARSRLRAAALGWSLIGTAVVLWLIYQEVGVIGRMCAWCTAVHVIVLALLVVQVAGERRPGA